MADRIVLLNGLPAAGKTTLAPALAEALGAHHVAKDALKVALADLQGDVVSSATYGEIASTTMWLLAAAIDGTVLAESYWYSGEDAPYARAGIAACGDPPAVEVWCDVPPEVSKSRYLARERHWVLGPAWDEGRWRRRTAGAGPLGIAPVVVVDTSERVDVGALVARIDAAFPAG